MASDVSFGFSKYLSGIPGTKAASGNLVFRDDRFGIGTMQPKKGVVAWKDVAGVSFSGATAAKSRAGKAVLMGPLALAAKNTKNVAHMAVHLTNGNVALYEVDKKNNMEVRGKVQPLMTRYGVPCLDDAPPPPPAAVAPPPPAAIKDGSAPSVADELAKLGGGLAQLAETRSGQPEPSAPPSSMAEEIGKLAELHQSGVLTDDEFSAAKARLLG